jgi:hypothetical protein
MENSKNNVETIKTVKLSIVEKVLAILGLDDKGRVAAFFAKETKRLEKQKITISKNLENYKFNYEQRCDELREQLEDAQDALDKAYLNVPIEEIKTNADADSFSEVYWNRIDKAEQKVQGIEENIKNEEKLLESEIKESNDMITILETRIEAIK